MGNTTSSGSSVVMYVSIAVGMCFLSCCIAMDISSGSAVLAFMYYAAICSPAEDGLLRPKHVGVLT
jgi:ribose/xylose/arabinose/galactoside ABC-type transport system permease subunit